jgi:TIR domain-containing protein
MARVEKTVFISYRRTDVYTALAVYENLKNQGYDVFFDYTSISSGDFEQIITSNIKARAHFVLILTPTALERCNEPGDWLRREIEIAIDEKRNIVPLFFKGFRFGTPSVSEILTGELRSLNRYNGLNVHEDYFHEAMQRLRTQFLNFPLNTVLHPVSTEVRNVVREEQLAADKALEQMEDVQELVKELK